MDKTSKINAIHQYWFNDLSDDKVIDKKSHIVQKWFIKNRRTDIEIKTNFEEDLIRAAHGDYDDWEDSLKGRMALIVLFDQFSRNIYRDTPKMFATDPQALALSLKTIDENVDRKLSLIERVFLYLPLEHSEDMRVQELSVAKFGELVEDSQINSPFNTAYMEYTLEYAYKHLAIIKEFGRFPHRNVILDRASTPQEQEFLKKPGSAF
jgi:uncharacterized protein (DUF924 family)